MSINEDARSDVVDTYMASVHKQRTEDGAILNSDEGAKPMGPIQTGLCLHAGEGEVDAPGAIRKAWAIWQLGA